MSRNEFKGDGFMLRMHERPNARRLQTIPTDHKCWDEQSSADISRAIIADFGDLKGAIIRLQVPAQVSDNRLREVAAEIQAFGPAALRIVTRVKPNLIPISLEGLRGKASFREVSLQLAQNSKRRAELEKLLDEYLTKVGL